MNENEGNQVSQARQLRIRGMDGKPVEKKELKEKEKHNKWLIVVILLITIVASLIFKWTSGVSESAPVNKGVWFGPAEYNFSK